MQLNQAKPVRPRKPVSIFAIVLGILIVGLLGLLIYNVFFSVATSLTTGQALKRIEQIRDNKTMKDQRYRYGKVTKIVAYAVNRFSNSSGTIYISYEAVSKSNTNNRYIQTLGLTVLNLESFIQDIKRISSSIYDQVQIKESYPLTVSGIFKTLFFSSTTVIIGFSLLLYYFLYHRMRTGLDMGGGQEVARLHKSKVMFSDVAGIKEEKTELLEIVQFIKEPQRYLQAGARIPKGLLLYGPPGTGKTLLAKAVSGQSQVPFFSAAGSSFEGMFVGLGASRIRDLFNKAKKNAPCIIFIDEIDSLGSKRQNTFSSVQSQSLNQFLSELDGFETAAGIIVIGATNRIEVLDSALLRSGRFDRKIQISLPDYRERTEILRIHARNKKFDAGVDFAEIASRTPGFSGAELENSLNEAALQAVRQNRLEISLKDIDEGIDRVIGGPAKTSRVVNKKTRTIVALHEAGHALIGLVLTDAAKVQKVTIIPRGSAGGYTVTTPKDETTLFSKETLTHQVIGLVAGRAAEELILGADFVTTGGYDDFTKATTIAERMVQHFGMSSLGVRFTNNSSVSNNPLLAGPAVSETRRAAIDKQIDDFLAVCLVKAKTVIKANLNYLYLIAESLLILETITADEIDYIYQNKALPAIALATKNKQPDKLYLDLDQFKKTTAKATSTAD